MREFLVMTGCFILLVAGVLYLAVTRKYGH